MRGVVTMPNWLINFFAGLGILETTLLVVGGLVLIAAIRNSKEE